MKSRSTSAGGGGIRTSPPSSSPLSSSSTRGRPSVTAVGRTRSLWGGTRRLRRVLPSLFLLVVGGGLMKSSLSSSAVAATLSPLLGDYWSLFLTLRGGDGDGRARGGGARRRRRGSDRTSRSVSVVPPVRNRPSGGNAFPVGEEEEEQERDDNDRRKPLVALQVGRGGGNGEEDSAGSSAATAAAVLDSPRSDDDETAEAEADVGVINGSATGGGAGSSSTMAQKRREFLDRIALISQSLLQREKPTTGSGGGGAEAEEDELLRPADDEVTPQSELTRPGRYIHVVTTAALPWFTGTSVNPLLRAAMLHRRTQAINSSSGERQNTEQGPSELSPAVPPSSNASEVESGNNTAHTVPAPQRWVTLVVPWLELPEDQQQVYGKVFQSEQEQEDYIRGWLRDQADMPDAACPDTGLEILFYPARYHHGLHSVFAMGDMLKLMDPAKMDVCILEEPEHVNWYRAPGDGWTKKFNYVIGIIHTSKLYCARLYDAFVYANYLKYSHPLCCFNLPSISAIPQTTRSTRATRTTVYGRHRQ